MNGRKLAIAIGAALALLGLAVFTEVWLPGMRERRAEEENLLLGPDERISALRIERAGRALELQQAESGAWSIRGTGVPEGVVADSRAIALVIRALQGTRITSVVGDAGELPLASYGLDPARVTLSWTRPSGRAWSLGLGLPSIAGQVHALAGDRVALVPLRVLEAADHGLDHFRVKRVLQADADEIVRMTITRRADLVPEGSSATLVLERRLLERPADDEPAWEWILAQPRGLPAQPVRVASLLSRLSSLTALGFGAEAPSETDLLATGLANPPAVLLIGLSDGREIRLALGDPSPDKNAWARADAGPVVEIRDDIARDALLPDDFWRDNRVARVPRWRVVNVTVAEGGDPAPTLEIARDPEGAWRIVEPADAELPAIRAEELLGAVEGLLCGRFEDEMASDPARLHRRWDFNGAGSIDLRVLALLADGTPRRADVEMTPFVRDRTPYFAAITTDEMGRLEACVLTERDVDEFLEKVRELSALARTAPSP